MPLVRLEREDGQPMHIAPHAVRWVEPSGVPGLSRVHAPPSWFVVKGTPDEVVALLQREPSTRTVAEPSSS